VPRRSIVLIAFVAVAACAGQTTITAKQLAAIMPSAADAPPDTTLQAEQAGPKTLAEFVTDSAVRAKLRSLGFKVGYVATFTTRNFPAELTTAPFGTKLYGAFAVLFRDGDDASRALAFYRTRSQKRAKNPATVLTGGLGKDAFAFRFSGLEDTPLPGIVYFWRVGNALFEVVGGGNPGPDPEAVRALTRTINSRALKAG
jgi:hypothetical protein